MSVTRRAFAVLGSSALSLAVGVPAQARARTITVLVAQPAGGITDAFARAVAPALGRRLGRVSVVENVAGASGSMAANRLLAATPEGGTIFVGSPSETVLAPLTLRSVRYRAEDFRLLGLLNNSPLALYARRSLPANNLDELVALGRAANDEPLSFGTTGLGGLFHLHTERLLSVTGMKATHIPYRGGMPMLMDLQAGTIDFALLPVDALLGHLVEDGKIKVLGVTSAQGLSRFPEASTFDQSKSAPRFGHPTIWVGLLIPAAWSARISAPLHQAAVDACGDTMVREAIERLGGDVPPPMSMEDAAHFYSADAAKLQTLAKAPLLDHRASSNLNKTRAHN